MGERKEKSWHGQTIAAIVQAIAVSYQLKPAMGGALETIAIPHIEQTNESDIPSSPGWQSDTMLSGW